MRGLLSKLHRIHQIVAPLTITVSIGLIGLAIKSINYWYLILALFNLYLLPLLAYRIQFFFTPLREGVSEIKRKTFNPWLASMRIQELYLILPILERLLFLVPGLYQAWLRCWGSRIGQNVYFQVNTTILDRGFLEVGDNVIIGNECYFTPHLVYFKDGKSKVLLKKIKIGSNKFIGGRSIFSPGAKVIKLDIVPALSAFGVNATDEFHPIVNQLR